MSRAQKPDRVATSGGPALGQNPFGSLSAAGLPETAPNAETINGSGATTTRAAQTPNEKAPHARDRGRVEIRRTTAGRGGKTVTLVSGFVGISADEKDALCKAMRAACGCGGTIKDGAIEIQGDQREKIAAILRTANFRPILSGG